MPRAQRQAPARLSVHKVRRRVPRVPALRVGRRGRAAVHHREPQACRNTYQPKYRAARLSYVRGQDAGAVTMERRRTAAAHRGSEPAWSGSGLTQAGFGGQAVGRRHEARHAVREARGAPARDQPGRPCVEVARDERPPVQREPVSASVHKSRAAQSASVPRQKAMRARAGAPVSRRRSSRALAVPGATDRCPCAARRLHSLCRAGGLRSPRRTGGLRSPCMAGGLRSSPARAGGRLPVAVQLQVDRGAAVAGFGPCHLRAATTNG